VDPSALIFVALAVAWAVYLIPKALEHHEAGERSRSISSFSHRLRVLGRRDAVSRRSTALMTDASATSGTYAPPTAAQRSSAPEPRRSPRPEPHRGAAASATRRRRNVFVVILVALVGTVAAAVTHYVSMMAIAAPVAVLVAWLAACRLMVRKERAVPVRRAPVAPASRHVVHTEQPVEEQAPADAEGSAEVDGDSAADVADSGVGRWDPVDVPLPTYVSKPAAARRTVRTIDLDGTGVWSSGRNEADSALAREADASRQSDSVERADRKTGS